MKTQSQPLAAGEAAHTQSPAAAVAGHTPTPSLTPVPKGPYHVGDTEAFGPGHWQTPVRGSDGKRLCTVVEREYMPKESGAVRASFIADTCNSVERLERENKGLRDALNAMTDRYAKAMKDAGVTHYPEALFEVRQARAALAQGGAS